MSQRLSNVEQRHELKTGYQIVDPRPLSAKFAEWLGQYMNLITVAVPAVLATAAIPLLSIVSIPFLLIITIAHLSARSVLPVRYPKGVKDDKGKDGTGIMYIGAVDSRSEYENFKEIWLSDDDMRKHILILGSTGSGKSEALKALFFNALSWSSGFFIADGKADNKLPSDVYTMCRSIGRDPDLLVLNFLLAGKTPEQVRRSRRRRTNKLNPFPAADADTIIQMGANLLPKVEGDSKNWQEKALNLWRSVVQALAYKRDTQGFDLSVSTFIEYMSLAKVEELYLEGYKEAQERDGEWSYGFAGIKNYLDSGCPSYQVSKLLKKNGFGVEEAAPAPGGFGKPAGRGGKEFEQDNMAYEQHSYRTNQLMPVLNLLDKTYGFIFRDKYPEIDMTDVTLRNRVLVMLIPSLEKSASEAENLGKLAIACLRVMMSKNLGAEVEGFHEDLLATKATNSPYPYLVALDELAYYFSDGIAVMFAQARSLGTSMIAAAQDLEKLTEGSRAAEAGAMIANTVTKFFMRIDDVQKSGEMIQKVVGKATVALRKDYRFNGFGYTRKSDVDVQEVDRVSTQKLQSFEAGQGIVNTLGVTSFMRWFYMGKDIEKHQVKAYYINRFLQVAPPSRDEVVANSIALDQFNDPYRKGNELVAKLRQEATVHLRVQPIAHLQGLRDFASRISPHESPEKRAILLYTELRRLITNGAVRATDPLSSASGTAGGRSAGGAQAHRPVNPNAGIDDLLGHGGTPGISPSQPEPEVVLMADDDELDENPLAFLNPTPFQRKPAKEVLGTLSSDLEAASDAAAKKQAEDEAVLVADPVESMLQIGRTVSLNDDAAFKGKALALLVGAPAEMPDPDTGLALVAKDDWIGEGIKDAAQMITAPRSSDETVIGLNDETATKVLAVEMLMDSPNPSLATKSFERVVAAKVTPHTVPEEGSMDVTPDELDSFFSQLETGNKS